MEAYRTRMERQAYMMYNLAGTIASMVLCKDKPEPWQCFPGWITPKETVMEDEEIYQSCLAWAGL